jgi:alkylation response protein AidB-like acyl-CoA dehydrogenase
MADENFYLDNPDLRFQIEHIIDWDRIINMREEFGSDDCPYESAEEAKATYIDMMADPVGAMAAQRIAPRAEEIDRIGCKYKDGEVIFPEGLKRNLKDLCDAQLMGLTIPVEFGGLHFPQTFYMAAIETISRADASLMNFFGLQGGIAETIAHFGSEELQARYLPGMATGELTGAMALTEADAGSDLANVQTKAGGFEAAPDADGVWRLTGTKRFITNGCGDVILVLARSEDPDKKGGGRGLSFFLVEKSDAVKVRRIEDKLGIHGSPTCELYFDNAPGYLIGMRGRGLARYTSWLMLAARLAVSAQAQGISEAAVKAAHKYADEREQFGKPIRQFPQVSAILQNMEVYTEASRALMYAVSQIVDIHQAAEKTGDKTIEKAYGKLADCLTPMCKYYATETANKMAYDAIQIHGGNGFMREYPVERLYRDARITNIYEGTSQIQVIWAIARIVRGDLNDLFDGFAARKSDNADLEALAGQTREALAQLKETAEFLKDKDTDYREWVAPHVVDMAIDIYVAFLFLEQAEKWDYKKKVARKFIRDMMPRVAMNKANAFTAEPVIVASKSEIPAEDMLT